MYERKYQPGELDISPGLAARLLETIPAVGE